MTKHFTNRYNDEIQCTCGLTWGIDEVDPHPRVDEIPTLTEHHRKANEIAARKTINQLKKDLGS